MTWLNDIFRSIFFFIDSAIYGVMQTLYNFLLDISKVQIFSESAIQNFATRIYAFLGIFMIFKLTVSMVQYVAEPEKLESDGKKIVINIMVALALMIILPGIVFPLSTRLQDAILDDGVIENLILGIDPTDTAGKTRKQAGRTVSYLSFSTFFYLAPCENVSTFIIQQKDDGTYETVLSAECESEITVPAAGNFIADYAASYEQKNMKMLREWVNEKNNNKEYLFTYNYIISSIVGLVELFIFFRFCFDISLRAVKLGFLQLIAPIPIISYADPKSKKVFDTYIKEYINTYLSLFIRLAAIYFAITIISMIANNQIYQRVDDGIAPVTNFWVQLFIIIGCLMFASEVPKLLEKLLGINVGSMSLNPFKNSPLAAGLVGGAIGAVGGGFAGFRAGSQAGAPVRGVLSGIGSGITTGAKTQPGKGVLRQSMDKSYQNLTGNHYEHMSPGRFIMGIGGQKKVDEIGNPLKQAYGQLQQKQTELNVASTTSSHLANELRNSGIDISSLNHQSYAEAAQKIADGEAKASAQRQVIDNARNEMSAKKAAKNAAEANFENIKRNAQSEYEKAEKTMKRVRETYGMGGSVSDAALADRFKDFRDAQEYIDNHTGADGNLDYTTLKEYADVTNANMEYDAAKKAYDDEVIQLNKFEQDIETNRRINEYGATLDKENTIRKDIASIEKDIETLKTEKSQRVKFYGVDEAPTQKVREAKQHIADRDNNI